MLELIGGIEVDGKLRRDVALAPLSGHAELVLAELGQARLSQPAKVSAFLAETVRAIGGQTVDPAVLAVGDRQYLVRQLGARMGRDLIWLSGTCRACGEKFEIPARQADLPVKPAGDGFPRTELTVDGLRVWVRSPTGADQEAIAGLDDAAAAEVLVQRLVECPAGHALTDRQRRAIDAAIEELSPEVALQVASRCPDCDAELLVDVDPYLALTDAGREIYDDIHALASRYHWSEADIVGLSRSRRKTYLALIDRDRGMTAQPGAEAFHGQARP